MPRDRTDLVDGEALVAFFADFDPATCQLLLDAALADFTEWSEKLIDAWATGDAEARQRARHSLKGLCGNFSATALLAMANADLADEAARRALRACRDATMEAMREAART